VVFAALIGSIMVSYTRARGESLSVSFDGGLFTRPERLLLLAVGSLINPFAPGLILFVTVTILAFGANVTAIYRFWIISKRLAQTDRRPPAPTTN
jgi:CDP-diacylglycerol--glycerol-3-phosphate 3-phosphatidyltransferase